MAEAPLLESIVGEEQRTVWNAEPSEVSLTSSPVDIERCTDAPLEYDITAEIHVETAFLGADEVSRGIQAAATRGKHRSAADVGITLLGESEAGKNEECKHGRKKGGLSQGETS